MKRITAAVAVALLAAPATASAASLEMRPTPTGSAVIAYDAAPGEVNSLSMRGTLAQDDFRMAFSEFSAPLTVGPGCVDGFPVVCGDVDLAFPVIVTLDDEDDVASVNSFTQDLTLDAGSGDDDVLAGGVDSFADGGPGNDTIRLAANSVATGNGGTGRDRIAAGLGAAGTQLDGGSGSDLVVPGGFISSFAAGGEGNDRLVSFVGRAITLNGDSGNDILVAVEGRGVQLDGGSDHDLLASDLGGVTVDAGSGRDAIDVRGGADTAADTVSCGSGLDVVWANADDSVADDCEIELRFNPRLRRIAKAVADARELLAHLPDPS